MTFKNVDYCLHGAKEGGREGNRERDGEWEKREKYIQFGRKASTDHPLEEGLG